MFNLTTMDIVTFYHDCWNHSGTSLQKAHHYQINWADRHITWVGELEDVTEHSVSLFGSERELLLSFTVIVDWGYDERERRYPIHRRVLVTLPLSTSGDCLNYDKGQNCMVTSILPPNLSGTDWNLLCMTGVSVAAHEVEKKKTFWDRLFP
ncbi:MAG TPA: hypothetical protein DDZ88_16290 [Verrucomicrobiales bacterium]|nr:hypothetical protein [Verrucomicrobiales bacterium]